MTTLTASAARQNLPEMVNRAAYGKERIAIARRGKVLAAIVSAEDLEALEEIENRFWSKEGRKALAEMKRTGDKGIPLAAFRKARGL